MITARFTTGVSFIWKENPYEIKRVLPNHQVTIEHVTSMDLSTVDNDLLVTAFFSGELYFADNLTPDKLDSSLERAAPGRELSDYSPQQVDRAYFRLSVIEAIQQLEPRTRQGIKSIVDERKQTRTANPDTPPLSESSAYRWLGVYEASGNDILSLIPETDRRGSKESPLSPEVNSIVDKVIDDLIFKRQGRSGQTNGPKLPNAKELRQEVAVRLEKANSKGSGSEPLKLPSQRTIQRRLNDLDPIDLYAAQYGQRAANQKFNQYGQKSKPKDPLTEVVADNTKFDVMVYDPEDNLVFGRGTVTIFLDLATGLPNGVYIGFEPPSHLTLMEAAYHAILPKENVREKYGTEHDWKIYGLFSTLFLDNAKENRAESAKGSFKSIGTNLVRGPVKTPWKRPEIERQMRTLNDGCFHLLPGTTLSNVQQRKDYDSVANAVISLASLKKILFTYILDIYAQEYHRGVHGIPAEKWERAIANGFEPALPESAEHLNVLLGRDELRTIQHYGIELWGLRYNLIGLSRLSELRARLDGKSVKVKCHPEDLSQIHIYDPFEQVYIPVPALAQDYTRGLTLWKQRVILREARTEAGTVDLAAMGRARNRIQDIVEESIYGKSVATHTRIARWRTAGTDDPSGTSKPTSGTPDDVPAPLLLGSGISASGGTPKPDLQALLSDLSEPGWETGPSLSIILRDTDRGQNV
ncbi:MAG: Mu transposase C-terminal domain-containing protein [Chloroflexota bacterium]